MKELLGRLFILGIIAFYIYYGFTLINNFKTKAEVIIYLVAYILFGITVLNLGLISVYWEVLSKKRGPPGPRGLAGPEGGEGGVGTCSTDHSIMFAILKIKKSVANAVVSTDDLTSVYDEKTGILKNNLFDTIINRIVQSKEFDTLLFQPETNDTTSKYGKSLKELTDYISKIITEWAKEINKLPKGNEFFLKVDGSFTISPEIEAYYHKEIEKYDIWYWGGTRVFKPLEITVMRQTEFKNRKGEIVQNSAFPMDNKPRIDIIEVEYSDEDTRNLKFLWSAKGIGDDKNGRMIQETSSNFSNWNNDKVGIYGKYIKPAIYIPKVKTIGKKRYYPVGCVMLESDKENKSSKRKKTILVSGDVVIPQNYTLMWKDRRQIHIIKNDGFPSDGYYAGLFFRLECDKKGYSTIGDIFYSIDPYDYILPNDRKRKIDNVKDTISDIKKKFNTNKPNKYTGIVAIPNSVIKKISTARYPEWSYKLNGGRHHGNKQIDIFTGANNENYNLLRLKNAKHNMQPLTKTNGNKVGSYSSDGGSMYKINMSAITMKNNPLKDTEPENEDLGFGYYGYPYLIADKYSIFRFLGLMPEGMLINYNNNSKYYFRHYGGKTVNRYNIFKYDSKTGRYDKALYAKSPDKVIFARMKPNDPRFGFVFDTKNGNGKYVRLVNLAYPNAGYLKPISQITDTKYDKVRNERPGGVSIDGTKSVFVISKGAGELNDRNAKLFMLIPAHGLGLNKKRYNLKNMKYPGAELKYT